MLKELKNSKFALENLPNETDIFTQFKSDSDCYYTRKKNTCIINFSFIKKSVTEPSFNIELYKMYAWFSKRDIYSIKTTQNMPDYITENHNEAIT